MKRPWNMVDVPVYSLATYDGNHVNMNICTYVSAVSMKPKTYMIAVYYHTKTIELLHSSQNVILQLLHTDQSKLIKTLGKKSGLKFDKAHYLNTHNLLTSWNGNQVLKEACAYLALKKIGHQDIGGDHELFWFEVTKTKTNTDQKILMFQELIEEGIIL